MLQMSLNVPGTIYLYLSHGQMIKTSEKLLLQNLCLQNFVDMSRVFLILSVLLHLPKYVPLG